MTARHLAILLATLALFGTGVALAHADLASADPAPESVVGEPPSEIRLTFTEPVELAFSVFEVHALAATDVDRTADTVWQRLNGMAGALVSRALEADEDESRVDTGPIGGDGRAEEVVLGLPEDLAPGVYVVMWRALSIDTHAVQDFYVFEYAPAAQP